ncbi:MAG: DNA-processing protein DprA, partial [Dictyoglomus sp.]
DLYGDKFIGIVGTRRPSLYGMKMAESFAKELVRYDFVIVSGLAYGIDTYAHRGALEGNGRTFAVLGSSLDFIYPSGNAKLAERIIENGAIISEYPLGTRPSRYTFPQRNRIISGICQGVLVIEAGEKSGALITANFAVNEGREVFAIPGRLTDEKSVGTNKLIKDGAKIVLDIIDILEEYGISYERRDKKEVHLSEEENKILQVLGYEPIFIEDLLDKLKIDLSKLMFLIASLQGKGFVEEYPGLRYAKKGSVIDG